MRTEETVYDKKDVRFLMVNPDTGEVVNEIYEGDSILRAESSEYLAQTIIIGKGKKFIKLFVDEIELLRKEKLTSAQWDILLFIMTHFRYDSGLVCFENGNPINSDDIAELAEMPKRTVFDTLEKLVSKKILAKNKTGHDIKYYINPYIFCKGQRINRTLHSMFKKSKWFHLYHAQVAENTE